MTSRQEMQQPWSTQVTVKKSNGHTLDIAALNEGTSLQKRSAMARIVGDCTVLPAHSVAEWLACRTQARKSTGSNRSRDAVE